MDGASLRISLPVAVKYLGESRVNFCRYLLICNIRSVNVLLAVQITKLCPNDFMEYFFTLETIPFVHVSALKQTVLFLDLTSWWREDVRYLVYPAHFRHAGLVPFAENYQPASVLNFRIYSARRGYIDRTRKATHRPRLHRKRIFR